MARDHTTAMLNYAALAVLSQRKQQGAIRDRFLILCGAEGCRAGWLEVSDVCFETICRHQPGLLLNQFPSFPAALRNPDVVRLIDRWQRWCPPERAEHLREQSDFQWPIDAPGEQFTTWFAAELRTAA